MTVLYQWKNPGRNKDGLYGGRSRCGKCPVIGWWCALRACKSLSDWLEPRIEHSSCSCEELPPPSLSLSLFFLLLLPFTLITVWESSTTCADLKDTPFHSVCQVSQLLSAPWRPGELKWRLCPACNLPPSPLFLSLSLSLSLSYHLIKT